MDQLSSDTIPPVAMPPGAMTPGAYLRKRREAAGLDLQALARHLVALPLVVREPTREDVDQLAAHLGLVEADRLDLTKTQAALIRLVIRFAADVYEHLVLLRDAGPDADLPVPSICRECACTWFVACVDRQGQSCNWTDQTETICNACAPAGADEAAPEGEVA